MKSVSVSESRCSQLKQCDSIKNASFSLFLLCSDCWNLSAAFGRWFYLTPNNSKLWLSSCDTSSQCEPLVEHLFTHFFPIYNQSGIQTMWEALHDPLINQHGDTLSRVKWISRLYWLLETGQAGARLLLPSLFLALPTVSVRRTHPQPCGWTTWSWCNSQGETKKERNEIEQNTAINAGRSLWVCTRVQGLYKGAAQPTPKYKYPWCYW